MTLDHSPTEAVDEICLGDTGLELSGCFVIRSVLSQGIICSIILCVARNDSVSDVRKTIHRLKLHNNISHKNRLSRNAKVPKKLPRKYLDHSLLLFEIAKKIFCKQYRIFYSHEKKFTINH